MTIEIIGTGVMGSAILKQLNAKNLVILASDKNRASLDNLKRKYKFHADPDFQSVGKADFVIIAVKPQDISDLGAELARKFKPGAIVLSIAAGVSLSRLQAIFKHRRIVRIMPNLGLSVGQGIAAWKASPALNAKDKSRVKKFLDLISENFEVKHERLLDSVTAISGSGPAYFFLFAQALEQTARKLGLDEGQSRRLVEKTMLASAFLQAGGKYDELIKRVASKGGTTEKALRVFAKSGLEKIVDRAVRAAHKRSKELGK